MRKSFLYLLVIALLFFSSCITVKTSTSKTMDIYGAGVVQFPMLVDLDIGQERVTGVVSGRHTTSFENLKQAAVADALESVDADVLVEPKFTSETSNGYITVNVTGFPATYKNFRKITAEDVELIEVGIQQKANVYTPAASEKKKNAGAAALITILVVLGLIAAGA